MFHNNKSRFLLYALMLLPHTSLLAVPVPILDLPALTRDSNLIVVGTTMSVRDIGVITLSWQGQEIPARRKLAELRISRILKGHPASSMVTFQFVETVPFSGFADIRVGEFGMFFLKPDSSNGLTVTNPYYPSVVSAPDASVTTGIDFERVVTEVSYVLVSAQTSFDSKVRAVAALERVNTPAVTKALRLAAGSTNENLRLEAVTTLLNKNDISKLETAERALLQTPVGADRYLINRLASALERIKDPEAIPALVRLLSARYARARRSAAAAIRNIGTDAAIEPLTKALYDNDQEVRYHAVMGLAMLTGQDTWGPSIDRFNKEEQRYLAYWRKWAKER